MTPYEKVRAKVVEVVPERDGFCSNCQSKMVGHIPTRIGCSKKFQSWPPITLADILMAMSDAEDGSWSCYVDTKYRMCFVFHGKKAWWNLSLNLEDQSPEVHEFLARVLGITN